MASISEGDESSAADERGGDRHLKFRCAYAQRLSSSTCESDSAAQSDTSENDVKKSPEVKEQDKPFEPYTYAELKQIKEELLKQRKENADMKEMLKQVLEECQKISHLYSDLKFEMMSLKDKQKAEEKPLSSKYVRKSMMRNRRKSSPSSLMEFSTSDPSFENSQDTYL